MTNKDLFEALRMFEKEKDIPMDYMLQQIQKAIEIACKNYYGGNENVVFKADPEKNSFDVKLVKTVVDEVYDPNFEVTLEEAQQINKRKKFEIGDEIEVPLDPKKLGRIAISAARNVIRQGIRAGEKGQSLLEFQSKLGEIATATVERVDPVKGIATIRIGKSEAMLPKSEQVGCGTLREGDHVKVYIADVKDNERGPHAIISRTHPGFVRRLFEQEVPEIYDGVVEIKSVSREAGSRTKMAVLSNNPDVDAIGACIGPKGARVNSIVDELGGEKIDIIEYSEEPGKYISAALSPATVLKVDITDEDKKSCKATVPDGQLSLAIGNKGQNARLAARLTGWRIDIRPESGFYGEDEDDEPVAEETAEEVAEETVEETAEEAVEETAEEINEEAVTADE
ncbi:MAG: transcription termination/antitermination protein NusA [Ruminococcus sp.]|nr:transcription termination/antitermination protein NusA [Ruminococcus sp.]